MHIEKVWMETDTKVTRFMDRQGSDSQTNLDHGDQRDDVQ